MVKKVTEEIRNGIIITIFSTASAVGKTLLSINMAAELANNGYQVCIADLDLQFGDVCNYLQLSPQQTIFAAQQAVAQNTAGSFELDQYLTSYRCGTTAFSVLAAPLKLEEAYNVSTPAVTSVLNELRKQYDYIVLDTTAAFSDLNLAIMDISTIITFVGIVDFIPTIKNMKVGYDTMRSIGYEKNKIRMILNRSNSKTLIELQDVEQLLEEHFYHVLPNDFATAIASLHNGIPLVACTEKTGLSRSIQELVAKYTNRLPADGEQEKASLSAWMKRIFT